MTVEFDGTGYVDCGNDASLNFERTDPFSVCVYARVVSTGAASFPLVTKGENSPGWQGWLFLVNPSGNVLFQLINDWAGSNRLEKRTSASGYDNGYWHHWIVTYDGSSNTSGVNIYRNGLVQVSTTPYNTLSATIQTAENATIGRRADGALVTGDIDEVAIYDKELSAGEALTVYDSFRGFPDLLTEGPFANLVSYWKMGDGDTFPTVTDSAGSNDGTMTSMVAGDLTWTGNAGGPVPDTTLPVLGNYTPAPGTTLEPSDSVAFDVTDDTGLFAKVMVSVDVGAVVEVAHTGDSFTSNFAQSTRVVIANGWRYTIRRVGGWTQAPTFTVYAIDAGGNISV